VVRALPNAVTERVWKASSTCGRALKATTSGIPPSPPPEPDAWHSALACATIAASAPTILLLLDAGVEAVSLYTADVTRTMFR